MTVVLDPRNELLDPAADTLELHPKLVAARDHAATPSEQQAEVTNAAHDARRTAPSGRSGRLDAVTR